VSNLHKNAEANIRLVKTQTPAGQVVHEFILVPTKGTFIPEIVEAFPVSQIVYFERNYVCTKYEPCSYEVREQVSFSTLVEALDAGKNYARNFFGLLVSGKMRIGKALRVPGAAISANAAGLTFQVH
jgi:hypothetical protein